MRPEGFMRRALSLARKGQGRTSPNPSVGAVIVKDGKVVSSGYHRRAGLAHAEAEAIANAKGSLKGSTLYVTLEPCCHFGRTPPCTDAIIKAGISRVVIGMRDPNPLVAGKGISSLERAGIECEAGVLEDACLELNRAYIKYITEGTPFVTLKIASTLDGRTATVTGESRWITGEASRSFVHKLRSVTDAVVVGASTVVKDDPELTVRLVRGRDPKKVILDPLLRIRTDAKVFDGGPPIIFTSDKAPGRKVKEAQARGAEVIILPSSKDGVELGAALKELGRKGITSVLVEAGGRLSASFLREGLADRLLYFLAPSLIGGDGLPAVAPLGVRSMGEAVRLKAFGRVKRIGEDIVIETDLRHG